MATTSILLSRTPHVLTVGRNSEKVNHVKQLNDHMKTLY